MPFIRDREDGQVGQSVRKRIRPEVIDRSMLGSAFSRENDVVGLVHLIEQRTIPADPNFVLGEFAKDDPVFMQHPDEFLDVESATEYNYVRDRLKQLAIDNRNLQAGGIGAFAASMFAGAASPTMFIPGGAAYKGFTAGQAALRSGLQVGASGAAAITLQEMMLGAAPDERTAGEQLTNIAAGTVLSAVMGAGIGALAGRAFQKANIPDDPLVYVHGDGAPAVEPVPVPEEVTQQFDEALDEMSKTVIAKSGEGKQESEAVVTSETPEEVKLEPDIEANRKIDALNAAADREVYMENKAINPTGTVDAEALAKGDVRIAPSLGVANTIGRISPAIRTALAEYSPTARQLGRMLETSGNLFLDDTGKPVAQTTVLGRKKAKVARVDQFIRESDAAIRQYRRDTPRKDSLTKREIYERAYVAILEGIDDFEGPKIVKDTAESWINRVAMPFAEEAKRLGFKNSDKFIENPRGYVPQKVKPHIAQSERSAMREVLAEYFGEKVVKSLVKKRDNLEGQKAGVEQLEEDLLADPAGRAEIIKQLQTARDDLEAELQGVSIDNYKKIVKLEADARKATPEERPLIRDEINKIKGRDSTAADVYKGMTKLKRRQTRLNKNIESIQEKRQKTINDKSAAYDRQIKTLFSFLNKGAELRQKMKDASQKGKYPTTKELSDFTREFKQIQKEANEFIAEQGDGKNVDETNAGEAVAEVEDTLRKVRERQQSWEKKLKEAVAKVKEQEEQIKKEAENIQADRIEAKADQEAEIKRLDKLIKEAEKKIEVANKADDSEDVADKINSLKNALVTATTKVEEADALVKARNETLLDAEEAAEFRFEEGEFDDHEFHSLVEDYVKAITTRNRSKAKDALTEFKEFISVRSDAAKAVKALKAHGKAELDLKKLQEEFKNFGDVVEARQSQKDYLEKEISKLQATNIKGEIKRLKDSIASFDGLLEELKVAQKKRVDAEDELNQVVQEDAKGQGDDDVLDIYDEDKADYGNAVAKGSREAAEDALESLKDNLQGISGNPLFPDLLNRFTKAVIEEHKAKANSRKVLKAKEKAEEQLAELENSKVEEAPTGPSEADLSALAELQKLKTQAEQGLEAANKQLKAEVKPTRAVDDSEVKKANARLEELKKEIADLEADLPQLKNPDSDTTETISPDRKVLEDKINELDEAVGEVEAKLKVVNDFRKAEETYNKLLLNYPKVAKDRGPFNDLMEEYTSALTNKDKDSADKAVKQFAKLLEVPVTKKVVKSFKLVGEKEIERNNIKEGDKELTDIRSKLVPERTKLKNRRGQLRRREAKGSSPDAAAYKDLSGKIATLNKQYLNILANRDRRIRKLEESLETLNPDEVRVRVQEAKDKVAKRSSDFQKRLDTMGVSELEDGKFLVDDYVNKKADIILDKMANESEGRIPFSSTLLERGSELERTLKIDPNHVWSNGKRWRDFLDKDLESVSWIYGKSVGADFALFETFGDLHPMINRGEDSSALLNQVTEEYRQAFDEVQKRYAGNDKKRKDATAKITKERARVFRDVNAMIDRIREVRGTPSDANGIPYRMGRAIRNLNTTRLMGGVMIASLPDPVRILQNQGIRSLYRDGFQQLTNNMPAIKAYKREAIYAGAAVDLSKSSRLMAIADVHDYHAPGSLAERGLQVATNNIGQVALFDYWNAWWKTVSGTMTVSRIMYSIDTVMNGRADGKELDDAVEFLARTELGEREIEAIWKQTTTVPGGGDLVNGAWLPNTESWTDKGAVDMLRAAIASNVDNTIITPGVERPLVMDGSMTGQLLFQFRSFAAASVAKTMIPAAQQMKRGNATPLMGLALSTALGALSYFLYSVVSGGKQREQMQEATFDKWLDEAVNRSGYLGPLSEMWALSQKIPGLDEHLNTGRARVNSYTNPLINSLGPTPGLANQAWSLISSLHDPGEQTVRSARKLMPYQNVWYGKAGLDWLEDMAGGGR